MVPSHERLVRVLSPVTIQVLPHPVSQVGWRRHQILRERSVVAVFVVDAAITGMAVIVSAIPSVSAAYLFLIIVTNLSALLSC